MSCVQIPFSLIGHLPNGIKNSETVFAWGAQGTRLKAQSPLRAGTQMNTYQFKVESSNLFTEGGE